MRVKVKTTGYTSSAIIAETVSFLKLSGLELPY